MFVFAALIGVRRRFPVLRYGRQVQRPISNFNAPFALPAGGELIAWSRLLDDEEALCVVNGNGGAAREGDVVVDAAINAAGAPGQPVGVGQPIFEVVANAAESASAGPYAGPHPVGQHLSVKLRGGSAFVEIRDLPPSEVLVLVNRP